jgi:hypothetical protein
MCLGHIGYYVNYKLKVVEPKWVRNYGCDVPHKRKSYFANLV